MRRCKTCGTRYEPTRPLQTACGLACALIQATQARLKKEAKADKAKREKLKSRATWMKEAQAAANAYVRKRDEGLPCISCGRHHQGQNHAGHYLSRGAHPELSLDSRNIHLQCAPCNTYLSGNQINYRNGLIKRYGQSLVDWLEGPHEFRKYTIAQLKIIASEYKIATRLFKEQGNARNLESGCWLRIEV
jgi:hypothetical protein